MNKLLSLLLLILLTPFLTIISMIIFVEDGFPIFYKQKRIGMNNKLFVIYKFRSMKKNTPLHPSRDFKDAKNYILKSGKYLRKYSLDEIPNLINILIGDMNFIGPRPALKSQIVLNNLRTKFGVNILKPGITGWAQINGRDLIDDETKFNYDLYYFKNKSMILDIEIILKTFKNIFSTKFLIH